jgi:hypothetical protein
MKTRKTIHEVSNPINTNQLDVTNLQFFKIFSLPIWLAVVMSISLGFVTKPVKAGNTGTEDVKRNYRYIKPKGVQNPKGIQNTAGSASQGTKESSTAKDTGAKKTNQGEPNTSSGTGGTKGNADKIKLILLNPAN